MTDGNCEGTAEVTRLLNQAGAGDAQAAEELLPLVYERLRALARQKMRSESSDQTLQATALVHEAYLRLVDQTAIQHWQGRWHFFAAAAEAMRRILVDHARHKKRLKRGGAAKRVNLDDIQLTTDDPPDDLLALDEALRELAEKLPANAQLVKLRYFAGLTTQEAAEALGISERTARRNWAYSRAWLYSRIQSQR
jgi:RNA polymerase sigma factor (TIGR02999 family)